MRPIDYLDTTYEQVLAEAEGAVWASWQQREPVLARLRCLTDLRHLRGVEADLLLGGLVRLAAVTGGDDELATRAVAHQLAGEARGVAIELRDLGPEVNRVVLGSLWIAIKEFPVQRRTRAFASSLRRETRRLTLRSLRDNVEGRLIPLDPTLAETYAAAAPEPALEAWSGPREELIEFLRWCVASDRITGEDAALVMDLVAAGWETAIPGAPRTTRGVCTLRSAGAVAKRQGICAKTVIRRRDRVLEALRDAAAAYLRDVA